MSAIHHVTAIAGDPARNLEFYARTLGLRFVKKTVNFDDPGTYHFYYGNETGDPGTILTFFAWRHAAPGCGGIGQADETALRIPARSLAYWTQRLAAKGVQHGAAGRRFDQPVLALTDADGLKLALIGIEGAEAQSAWSNGEIPAEHAIRGVHGVTLLLRDAAPTAAILTDVAGHELAGRDGATFRYRAAAGTGGVVDIRVATGLLAGRVGRGSVHHIAFRAKDDAQQAGMVRKLVDTHGLQVTEQKDRKYFRSVYYREPGGALFEIATDGPGFAVDEPLAKLGTELKLPAFLEPTRSEIEAALPRLDCAAC
jgi:glyoxalase family protein